MLEDRLIAQLDEGLAGPHQLALLDQHPGHRRIKGSGDAGDTAHGPEFAVGIHRGFDAGDQAIDDAETGESDQGPDNAAAPAPGAAGQGGAALAMLAAGLLLGAGLIRCRCRWRLAHEGIDRFSQARWRRAFGC